VSERSPLSTTGRRIITAKTIALAVMALVFAVVAIWHRRRLDDGTAEHRSHSPSSDPAGGSGCRVADRSNDGLSAKPPEG